MSVSTKSPVKSHPFLLDGKWIGEGKPLEVFSPYDGNPAGTTFWATSEQLDRAIAASVRAFETTRRMPAYERQRTLRAISDAITSRQEEFARSISVESGKPIKTARAEVERAILTFTVAAEESVRIGGEWIPLDLLPAMERLRRSLAAKAAEFHGIVKIGRTNLQDAVPMRLEGRANSRHAVRNVRTAAGWNRC